MFPGQGAYLPGVLADRAAHVPQAAHTLEAIDEVVTAQGHAPVAPLLLDRDAPSLQDLLESDSDRLDLAIFAINAVAAQLLAGVGVRGDVLMGHSFGEFAALSTAGAVSVADVARMACARIEAFRRAAPEEGGLVALDVPAWRADHLVGVLDEPGLRTAIDNGPEQTVVSGPSASLDRVEKIAVDLGVRATRLRARYAFHNPLLNDAADYFRQATADVAVVAPRMAVFSPVLGRYVSSVADVRDVIERNMIAPVPFYDALLTVFRQGTRVFVEAGARQALTGIVRSSLPASVTAVPLLASRGDMESVVAALGAAGVHARFRPEESRAGDEVADGPKEDEVLAPRGGDSGARARLLAGLTALYAEELGFPAEMLTADVDLEADLGVDSAKQIALFERVRQQYGLPEAPGERRNEATTLERIADLVEELRG
ncbi:acyltransferase domain-containing protein [Streptomyces achromogenes]|uniref:acyltransferase domain-containing protein n=1 Tax=Streptomyces achromogenes TaxID=67255 RepID=UPI0007C4BC2A|nr:acyltransferase domain-containing protein [Streptomyces achromogenes]